METIFACALCASSWSKDGGEKRGYVWGKVRFARGWVCSLWGDYVLKSPNAKTRIKFMKQFFLLIPDMLSYFEHLWNLVCLCTRKVYYLAVCCNIELVVFWFVLLHYSSTSSVVSVHCLLTLCCKVNMKHTIIRANLSWSNTTAESPDQKHHEEK